MNDRRWLPPLLWAAVMLLLTSIPNPNVPSPGRTDLVAHLAMYGGLGYLLARAPRRRTRGTLAAIAVGASLYGALDEWHQQFIPGRSASIDDWVADTAGAALGVIAYAATARKRREPIP